MTMFSMFDERAVELVRLLYRDTRRDKSSRNRDRNAFGEEPCAGHSAERECKRD